MGQPRASYKVRPFARRSFSDSSARITTEVQKLHQKLYLVGLGRKSPLIATWIWARAAAICRCPCGKLSSTAWIWARAAAICRCPCGKLFSTAWVCRLCSIARKRCTCNATRPCSTAGRRTRWGVLRWEEPLHGAHDGNPNAHTQQAQRSDDHMSTGTVIIAPRRLCTWSYLVYLLLVCLAFRIFSLCSRISIFSFDLSSDFSIVCMCVCMYIYIYMYMYIALDYFSFSTLSFNLCILSVCILSVFERL